MKRTPTKRQIPISVRQSRPQDSTRLTELLEMNGASRALASEEVFLVAERSGDVLAALEYRVGVESLTLGTLVVDPWVSERLLGRALYAEVHAFACELGLTEVHTVSPVRRDYPYEIGYHRRYHRWYLGADDTLKFRGGLPDGGWRRVLGLWGVTAIPFFGAFRS